MKKTMTAGILCIFFLGLFSQTGFSQDVKDILEKSIEAQGGRKVIEKIKDATYTGTMELIQFGMSGSLVRYQKEPNKFRMDIEVMGMMITQAYDGQMAWMISPESGVAQEMPEQLAEDMKRGSLGNDAMLNPEKYGITYASKGKETIEGTEHHIIEQTYKDGETITMYINGKTFLPYKTIGTGTDQMGGDVEEETFLSDYKKVDGMIVPFSINIFQDGEEFLVMTVTEVKLNTNLEDSLFQMEK